MTSAQPFCCLSSACRLPPRRASSIVSAKGKKPDSEPAATAKLSLQFSLLRTRGSCRRREGSRHFGAETGAQGTAFPASCRENLNRPAVNSAGRTLRIARCCRYPHAILGALRASCAGKSVLIGLKTGIGAGIEHFDPIPRLSRPGGVRRPSNESAIGTPQIIESVGCKPGFRYAAGNLPGERCRLLPRRHLQACIRDLHSAH